ncbi:hypothetical protein HMPREF0080_01816 [Anaeroglobus geminatus F0357]|uniref:Uncharacterized protein n=1 Tax=Anaeroglobus geminatus F0357 TaxID=861450 RepID=G9YJG5_9FIRM|nr:hypothetical protein HMPREF0080_01816 [Anaeroglobus geminatus F0357]
MVSLLTGFLFFGVSRIAYCPLNDKYFQKGDFGEPGHILCFPPSGRIRISAAAPYFDTYVVRTPADGYFFGL